MSFMEFGERLVNSFIETNRKSMGEFQSVPIELTPAGKDVAVSKTIESNLLPSVKMMYKGQNGFTYVDPKAVELNYDAVMAGGDWPRQ
jgi:hypothetical protein